MLHQSIWLSCRASVSAGRNTGDGVGRLRQVRAFCFSTPGAEHSHLRCSSTAALCRHHHTSHCRVFTHTLWSNTTSQLQRFGPGSNIWAGSLVLVLQMPSGQRQYLWAECKVPYSTAGAARWGRHTLKLRLCSFALEFYDLRPLDEALEQGLSITS